MAKPTETNDDSPLEKWRRWKDKVFEADSVVSDEPPAEPVPVLKETPQFQKSPQNPIESPTDTVFSVKSSLSSVESCSWKL